jgi:hypothetical protein
MTKIVNKLGTFYIKHKMHNSEINRTKSSEILKCYDKNDMPCTIFDKDIINKTEFFIIN